MEVKIVFTKTGYHIGGNYIKQLKIMKVDSKGFWIWGKVGGRDTYLAKAIETYCVKKGFLDGHNKVEIHLDEEKFKLLKLMCDIPSYHLFKKALEEKWSEEKLKTKLVWKLI